MNIGTLNLCLGLKNKKLEVENLMSQNEISILCMQEVEIESNYDPNVLNIKNYNFELEVNSIKSRTGIFISKSILYRRMKNLEGVDSNLIIIDIVSPSTVKRIINVYRSFNPQNNVNARMKFKYQLNLIKNAMIESCVIVGDFNIDYSRIHDDNYCKKNLFEDFDITLSDFSLIQMVNCTTWSRLIGNVLRTSILDHIYVRDPTIVSNLKFIHPFFGDHKLVVFTVNAKRAEPNNQKRRDWRFYSKETLNARLACVDLNIDIDCVQQYWNVLENKIIKVIDEIVPLSNFTGHVIKESIPKVVKNKINKRNRLLKSFKHHPNPELKKRITDLNCEIRTHFFGKKRFQVRKGILPGNSKSLWQAVKIAKNVGETTIPDNMSLNSEPVPSHEK